jgi:peptide/nickel transport system permease protein
VRFILRRLLTLIATLLVASFVIYGALYLAPGSPIATLTGSRTPPPDVVATLNARYHLNDPFLTRYSLWLKDVVSGDLGTSIPLQENVTTLIRQRAGVTAELVLYASLIITIGGIGLGLLGALRPGLVDLGVIGITTLSAAMPSFVAAVILLLVFSVELGWFPALGTGSGFIGTIDHLTLPAVALAATSLALVARVTRAAVREELGREHVQTAIGRGIAFRLVVRRHVLRNAAIPIVTVSGLTIASLIALAAVIETAFNLNGLGQYLVSAALNNDFATVQGISMVLVAVFVITNAIVDVFYAILDPRVTLGTRAR